MTFLNSLRLSLTPLTPIHIGSGEDIDPTSYVIDDGVLYQFEPSVAVLSPPQRQQLMQLVNTPRVELRALQQYIHTQRESFKACAHSVIPVCTGLEKQYQRQIKGQAVELNKLAIEQHLISGISGQSYIPGSSLKGALVTGWLDKLNQGKAASDAESGRNLKLNERLLKGNFASSPMRLFKPSDLMPSGSLLRRVVFASNHYKVARAGQPRGVQTRKDCIWHGQFRALQGDLTLHDLQGNDSQIQQSLPSATQMLKHCHAYHWPRWQKEMDLLRQRGLVDLNWLASIEQLLAGELKPLLDQGQACLIRLGRYGGAESKTLSGHNVARIKIMQAKGNPAANQSTTKTLWLATETEAGQQGLPFGWALLELNPQTPLPNLQTWCQRQRQAQPDIQALHQHLQVSREALQTKRLARQAEAAQQRAATAEEERRQQEAAAQRATLPAHLQAQAALQARWDSTPRQANTSHPLFNDVYELLQVALLPPWEPSQRVALADQFNAKTMAAKFTSLGKKEKDLKQLLRQLKGETS